MSKIIYTTEETKILNDFKPNIQPLLNGQSCFINAQTMQFKEIVKIYETNFLTKLSTSCSACVIDAIKSLYNTLAIQPKTELIQAKRKKIIK